MSGSSALLGGLVALILREKLREDLKGNALRITAENGLTKNAAKPVVDEALVYYVSFNRTRDKLMITAEIGANVCMSVCKHSTVAYRGVQLIPPGIIWDIATQAL